MALRWLDSFDHYVTADLAEKYTANSGGTIIAAAGRNGSSAWRGGSGANYTSKGLSTTSTTLIMGAAVKVISLGNTFFNIGETGFTHIMASTQSDGSLIVQRASGSGWQNTGGTIIATSAAGLVAIGTYFHIQCKVVIADAPSGSVELRLNGVTTPVASASGIDTRQTGTPVGNIIYIGSFHDIDDLWVCDGTGSAPWNDFLGDCRVDARYPTGASANGAPNTGWTPSTGSNWSCVDETGTTGPNDDTDYVSTATLNAIDTYVTQDAPSVGATIYGVQHCLAVKKADAGVATIAPVIRHSSVDYPGTTVAPSTGYAFALQVAQTNPGTSAQWTEANFNSAEFGYKRIS